MTPDGIFTYPKQHGVWITEPDNVTQSVRYRAIYRQWAVQWRRQPFGLQCPYDLNATLTSETTPRGVGAGIVEWEREFRTTPPARDEFESFTMGYQIQNVVDGQNNIGTIAIPVTSRIHYDYFYVPSSLYPTPDDIPQLQAYKLLQYAPGVILQRGTLPGVGATEMVAEDSQINRWAGNIYQRKTRYVPTPSFSVLT